jgi:hypothetical protein
MIRRELPIRPQPYSRLLTTYLFLALYGFTATLGYIPSLEIAFGYLAGGIWSALLFAVSVACGVSLGYSRKTRRFGWEIGSTLALIGLLFLYAVGILIYSIVTDKLLAGSATFLPLIIMVHPFARLTDLVRTPKSKK